MPTESVSSPTMPTPRGNPFTPGAIAPAERFYGRKHELNLIRANLENMLSMSLVGEARIGKSSLLRYLEARLPAILQSAGNYLPIYLSMDGHRSQATLCQAVLKRLLPKMPRQAGHERTLRTLERRIANNQPVAMDDMVQALEWAAQANLRVILLLDEFKDLLERPAEFDDVFRGLLRSLYTNRTVALVMATRQSLSEIAGLSTYFANGIPQSTLGLMMHEGAEQLLRQPHDRPFSEAEVRMALEAGRLHPLRLQWAGFWLYEWKGQPPGPIYQDHGTLRSAAHRILNQVVQREYDQAMDLSRPPPVRAGKRTGWMTQGNTLITHLGDAIDAIKARVYAVGLLIACGIVLVVVLLYLLGVLTYDQLKEMLRRLPGGS